MHKYKIERRPYVSGWTELLAIFSALVTSLIVCAIIIKTTSDAYVTTAFISLFKGAFGNKKAIMDTLVQATPLIFTGLATVVAFRGRIWNIGGEGQFYAGAMMAAWISMNLGSLPQVILVPTIIIGSMIGGATWAAIAGYLKAQFGSNEIIVTVMMNYLILFLLSYLLLGPWQAPDSQYLQTILFSKNTYLPAISGSHLDAGFFLGLIAAVLIYVLLWRTSLGYEIRSIGVNPVAAQYKGLDIKKTIIIIMIISGALAGLGGGAILSGVHHRLRLDISPGYGFTGILVAMMARLNPFGVILAAIFLGAIDNGSTFMQIETNVPVALIDTYQGIVLLLLIISFILVQYRVRRTEDAG